MFEYVLADNEKKIYHSMHREACKIADENLIMRSSRSLRSNPSNEDLYAFFMTIYFDLLRHLYSPNFPCVSTAVSKSSQISDLIPVLTRHVVKGDS